MESFFFFFETADFYLFTRLYTQFLLEKKGPTLSKKSGGGQETLNPSSLGGLMFNTQKMSIEKVYLDMCQAPSFLKGGNQEMANGRKGMVFIYQMCVSC